jgi:hypothetical protein
MEKQKRSLSAFVRIVSGIEKRAPFRYRGIAQEIDAIKFVPLCALHHTPSGTPPVCSHAETMTTYATLYRHQDSIDPTRNDM